MLFEVIKKDEVLMCTAHPICVYNDATLKVMQSADCTFRLDGKRASIKEVKSFRENGS